MHYTTVESTPDRKIDLVTEAEYYSSTTYAITTYIVTTYHDSGFAIKMRMGTKCYWVDGL